jgi:hypothetical protein
MTVVVQLDLSSALTALSMTRMTSLTSILLALYVTIIAFVLTLDSYLKKETEHVGCLTVRFGFKNIHMVCSTLAHAQTNYHVSQFGN